MSVDARAPSARDSSTRSWTAIGFEPTWRLEPVDFCGLLFDALWLAAPGAPGLVSGAGHDAMVLAAAGVPTAMLFVRSLNGGVSHLPDELSTPEDIALAVDVLTAALDRLALRRARARSWSGASSAAARVPSPRQWSRTATGPT